MYMYLRVCPLCLSIFPGLPSTNSLTLRKPGAGTQAPSSCARSTIIIIMNHAKDQQVKIVKVASNTKVVMVVTREHYESCQGPTGKDRQGS